MTGLVPVIRPNASAFGDVVKPPEKLGLAGSGAAWMAGTSPAMTERGSLNGIGKMCDSLRSATASTAALGAKFVASPSVRSAA
jgi:hypothetical protein